MTTVKQETPQWYELRIASAAGDDRYTWPPTGTALLERPEGIDDATKVVTKEEAEAKFNEIVKGLKFLAYTAPTDGSVGTAIREFDPEASIVAVPQMQGG